MNLKLLIKILYLYFNMDKYILQKITDNIRNTFYYAIERRRSFLGYVWYTNESVGGERSLQTMIRRLDVLNGKIAEEKIEVIIGVGRYEKNNLLEGENFIKLKKL